MEEFVVRFVVKLLIGFAACSIPVFLFFYTLKKVVEEAVQKIIDENFEEEDNGQ